MSSELERASRTQGEAGEVRYSGSGKATTIPHMFRQPKFIDYLYM